MTITEWFADLIGDDSVNAAAGKADINQSTLSRQLNAGRLSPEMVVPLARAYGADVIDALVVHGLISPEDVQKHAVRAALADATDAEIADEVWKRLNDGREHATFDEAVGPAQLHPVPDLPEDAAALEGEDPDTDNEQ